MGRRGFTLIEVLVAIVILSIGLLGMSALTAGIINGNKFSNRLTMATTCAQEQMENVRRLGYLGMPITDTITTENYNSITRYSQFKRETKTDVAAPTAGMKTITVATYWDSNAHKVEIKTILCQ